MLRRRILEIDNAREEDSGMYECMARNLNDTVVFGKVFDVSVVPRWFGVEHNIFISDSLKNQVKVRVKVIHSLLFMSNVNRQNE